MFYSRDRDESLGREAEGPTVLSLILTFADFSGVLFTPNVTDQVVHVFRLMITIERSRKCQ